MGLDVIACLSVCCIAPHSQAAARAISYVCIVEQNSLSPIQRRLSLTHAGLGKNICNGAVLTSAINEWSLEVFFITSCFICNLPIVPHWCLTEQDHSTVPVLEVQVAADAQEMGT